MTRSSGKGEIEMDHPKSGQTCHAARTEQNHEGEKALHTKELQNYNHDNDSKQEENTMALRADLLKTDLRIVERQDESTLNKIFEKAAERAINRMTLDERIESFRRWPFAGEQQDFKALLKMQYERDTEDYSNPGTWYGVIRKWQAMTKEEALAAFRTDWYEGHSSHSQEDLKALYQFVKDRPMPPLSEQEKLDYYNRRIEPACLKKLFKEMSEANLTHIFEDTYDYNHSAVWEVCEDDFQPFRNSEIRPDVLESLLSASSDILKQTSQNNVIPFRPTSKKPEPRGIERLKAKRRGFVTLAWDGDYDLFTGLQAMDWSEFCEVAQTQGIQVDEVLRSFYNKIQAWQPPNRPICREPDECPVTPEQTELYRSFTDAEGFCHDKFVQLFCSLPNIQETAPISDLKALTDCLEWLCDEDLLQLKAAIDGKVEVKQFQPIWPDDLTDKLMNVAEEVSQRLTIDGRLDYMRKFVAENPGKSGKYAAYIQQLERRHKEFHQQDYSDPTNYYGMIMHLKSLSEQEALAELGGLETEKDVLFTEEELKACYKQIQAFSMPELSSEELARIYATGETNDTLSKAIHEHLDDVTGHILWQYGDKQQIHECWFGKEYMQDDLKSLAKGLEPDVLYELCRQLKLIN